MAELAQMLILRHGTWTWNMEGRGQRSQAAHLKTKNRCNGSSHESGPLLSARLGFTSCKQAAVRLML